MPSLCLLVLKALLDPGLYSFNWTRAAVITNRENIVITKQASSLIHTFLDEFNAMWIQYHDNTKIPK